MNKADERQVYGEIGAWLGYTFNDTWCNMHAIVGHDLYKYYIPRVYNW